MTKVKTLCWECTGEGRMLGFYPCKVCHATGYIEVEEPVRTGVETSESEEFDPDDMGESPWSQDLLPPIPPQHPRRNRLPRIEDYKP